MNTKNFESEIMAQLAEIRAILSNTNSSSSMKEKKPRKPRDPDAPPKAPSEWILFTGRVRSFLKNAGLPAGKEAQQFASHLKGDFPDAYNMDESEMLAAHKSWIPKPKEEKKEKEEKEEKEKKPPVAAASAEVPKPKPVRKPMSDEHKAKLAAGRKAAAEKKKGETAGK